MRRIVLLLLYEEGSVGVQIQPFLTVLSLGTLTLDYRRFS